MLPIRVQRCKSTQTTTGATFGKTSSGAAPQFRGSDHRLLRPVLSSHNTGLNVNILFATGVDLIVLARGDRALTRLLFANVARSIFFEATSSVLITRQRSER